MAKKRTRKDKVKARRVHTLHPKTKPRMVREKNEAEPDSPVKKTANNSILSQTLPEAEVLLGYPTGLLYKDLLRSLAITLLLVVVLIGIYLYLQYGVRF